MYVCTYSQYHIRGSPWSYEYHHTTCNESMPLFVTIIDLLSLLPSTAIQHSPIGFHGGYTAGSGEYMQLHTPISYALLLPYSGKYWRGFKSGGLEIFRQSPNLIPCQYFDY